MDERLLAWGRAVKKRQKSGLPVLWLFTDPARLADATISIRALPKNLCGVVFRHDGLPDRDAAGARIAALCQLRGLEMVVAGDTRLARKLGVGVHLRGGRYTGIPRPVKGLMTSSVHNLPELLRARRAGATILFISPAFETASHPGTTPLGACRWSRLAMQAGNTCAYGLGGITGSKINRLATYCHGAGAIHALRSGIS
jgi:thiamine-phosphate pyrophosphorylase